MIFGFQLPDPIQTSKAVADGIEAGGVLYVLCLVVIVVVVVSYFQNTKVAEALGESAKSQVILADACREMKSTLNSSATRDEDTRIKIVEHDARAKQIHETVLSIDKKVDRLHCVRAKQDIEA